MLTNNSQYKRDSKRGKNFTNSPCEREVFYFVAKQEHQGGRSGLYFENIYVSIGFAH